MTLANHGYKSAEARRRYLRAYDELRTLSPSPTAVHDVATEFGAVRVYQHGLDRGVPIVLIHGFFLTSAMWWAQIDDLSGDFTVYAIDMPGQPGAGIQTRKMATRADAARCIDMVLARLGVEGAHLVGHSYGGWLATHTAARRPRRIATLTLIDPAHTVVRLSARFWRSLAVFMLMPRSKAAHRAAGWVTGHPAPGSPVDQLRQLFIAGFDAFGPPLNTPPLRFCGDDLLRSVQLPVQVLLAGHSVHNSQKAIQRIQSVAPTWRYRLWPKASHCVQAEVPVEINACIREFADLHAPPS